MKQCTCYALRAIDCTCKPAKYGELYTSPTAKQEQGEPKQEDYLSKAYRLANELRCHLAIAPAPQHREWVDLNGEELETLLSENRTLTLGAIWAVSNKLRSKNGY